MENIEKIKMNFKNFKESASKSLESITESLAIGVTFAFLQTDIFSASTIIALVTFALCVVAIYIGKKLGSLLESKAEFIGGLILIGLGVKILLEHLNLI